MTEDQMRAAFEAWLNPGQHAGNVSPWVAPGRYEKEAHQLAWLAWRAASEQAALALVLAASRIDRLALDLPYGSQARHDASDWASEARQAAA